MGSYKFAVEHTPRAYAPGAEIPEHAWYTLSKHTSLDSAYARKHQEEAEMRRICGPTAWCGHYRIIALQPVQLHDMAWCATCGRAGEATMTVQPGEDLSKRADAQPAGWVSPHYCSPECKRKGERDS